MGYWLLKSEADVFSIDDLEKSPRGKATSWTGVRNYQARNFMRDQMKKGDLAFFYHSSSDPTGIAGIAEIARESHPDETQFDKKSEYFEPKATRENPVWFLVDVKFKQKFKQVLTLQELKKIKGLEKMVLLRPGSRLSVQPVTEQEWKLILDFISSNQR